MNAMIEEWVKEMLSRNGARDISDLPRGVVLDEIQDTRGSIKNEKMWELGAPTKSSAAMNLGNIDALEEYAEFLEALVTQPDTAAT